MTSTVGVQTNELHDVGTAVSCVATQTERVKYRLYSSLAEQEEARARRCSVHAAVVAKRREARSAAILRRDGGRFVVKANSNEYRVLEEAARATDPVPPANATLRRGRYRADAAEAGGSAAGKAGGSAQLKTTTAASSSSAAEPGGGKNSALKAGGSAGRKPGGSAEGRLQVEPERPLGRSAGPSSSICSTQAAGGSEAGGCAGAKPRKFRSGLWKALECDEKCIRALRKDPHVQELINERSEMSDVDCISDLMYENYVQNFINFWPDMVKVRAMTRR